ncbi:MAG: hypothetical protein ACI4HM_03715 [Ruminococcus sp.]
MKKIKIKKLTQKRFNRIDLKKYSSVIITDYSKEKTDYKNTHYFFVSAPFICDNEFENEYYHKFKVDNLSITRESFGNFRGLVHQAVLKEEISDLLFNQQGIDVPLSWTENNGCLSIFIGEIDTLIEQETEQLL